MYKYSFLVHHSDFISFKENLKEKGVLHIKERDIEPGAEVLDNIQQLSEVKRHKRRLLGRKADEHTVQVQIPQDGSELIEMLKSKNAQLDTLHHEQQQLDKEVEALKPWGDFSWDTIHKLKKQGIKVRFFYTAAKKYDPLWEREYSLAKISEERGFVYFVFYDTEDQTLDLDVDEIKIPEKELSDLKKQLDSIIKKIDRLNQELDKIAEEGIPVLDKFESDIQDRLNDASFLVNSGDGADGKIKIVEGWVPKSLDEGFENYIKEQSVYYIREQSTQKDKPPILLQNGRFSKLFEPIGKLFSLPSYAELDLTAFFAPFFFLFFGFCLGDAGYGLLLLIGAGVAKYKVDKDMKPLLSLVQWLGVGTILFGVVTGTFFGIKLMDVNIPFFTNLRETFLDDQQMFNLALGFGFVQILFGMAIKVANGVKQNGWKHSLSAAGWFLFFISTAIMVILDAVGGEEKWLWSVPHIILISISGLGIFVLNDPKRNVFMNIGVGLWDTYNMITGFAGDLLSYIRLFALGLSSAILGLVFNSLAFDLAPDIPVLGWIVTLIILVLGHGLNLFMASLGAVVHPMRLTFVEFYKNAGFVGGGKEYKPFSKISK
ncbi:V-type ATP synthase subunit I [Saccharicrinis carchari]|nr:V-type ATPase 116kDa subunit family protein [Saccharicrinis carchari]